MALAPRRPLTGTKGSPTVMRGGGPPLPPPETSWLPSAEAFYPSSECESWWLRKGGHRAHPSGVHAPANPHQPLIFSGALAGPTDAQIWSGLGRCKGPHTHRVVLALALLPSISTLQPSISSGRVQLLGNRARQGQARLFLKQALSHPSLLSRTSRTYKPAPPPPNGAG